MCPDVCQLSMVNHCSAHVFYEPCFNGHWFYGHRKLHVGNNIDSDRLYIGRVYQKTRIPSSSSLIHGQCIGHLPSSRGHYIAYTSGVLFCIKSLYQKSEDG